MNDWDDRYTTADYVYGTLPNDFIAAECHRIPLGPVLCLAEGEGRNAVHLAQQGFAVTAVDMSAVGLAKAAQLAHERGVSIETRASDLAEFDLGLDKWSGIVSVFAHLPSELRAIVHARVVDALAPGGVFLLEAYTPRHRELGGIGGPQQVSLLMTLDALRLELSGLQLAVAREIERDVNEGQLHRGRAAVVQIAAIKPA